MYSTSSDLLVDTNYVVFRNLGCVILLCNNFSSMAKLLGQTNCDCQWHNSNFHLCAR
jgi:hypothetical protein